MRSELIPLFRAPRIVNERFDEDPVEFELAYQSSVVAGERISWSESLQPSLIAIGERVTPWGETFAGSGSPRKSNVRSSANRNFSSFLNRGCSRLSQRIGRWKARWIVVTVEVTQLEQACIETAQAG